MHRTIGSLLAVSVLAASVFAVPALAEVPDTKSAPADSKATTKKHKGTTAKKSTTHSHHKKHAHAGTPKTETN